MINFTEALEEVLEDFDICWTQYEKIYVSELMSIEKNARRLVVNAIEINNQISRIESINSINIEPDIIEANCCKEMMEQFIAVIAQINAIANYEGHGRDDLTYAVVQSAKDVLVRVSVCESESLRKLAQNIIKSFSSLRKLFNKYGDNIEIVDPQLRNNPDLVDALVEFEKFWEKGNIYFDDKSRCRQLVYFTNVIEGLCEKYPDFKEKLECCDSDVFIIIPMIIILKRVDDEDQGLGETFLPDLLISGSDAYENFKSVKSELQRMNGKYLLVQEQNNYKPTPFGFVGQNIKYNKVSGKPKTLLKRSTRTSSNSSKLSFEFFKMIETIIVRHDSPIPDQLHICLKQENTCLENLLKNMHSLSFEMQRNDPAEWNSFLDICLHS